MDGWTVFTLWVSFLFLDSFGGVANKSVKNSNRKLRDVFLCHLKIVLGFFQVTAGMMKAYAFIKWPKYLADIANFADLIQLNVLRIAPMECINLIIYPFDSMVIMLAVNALVVAAAVIACLSVRSYLRWRRLASEEQQAALSKIRVTLYRYTILTLFTIYSGTCSSITRTIPCQTICQSVDDIYSQCPSYLRADYRIECNESYRSKKIFSYVALSYLLLYPTLAFGTYINIQKNREKAKTEPKKMQDEPQNTDNTTATQKIVEDETPVGGADEEEKEDRAKPEMQMLMMAATIRLVVLGKNKGQRRFAGKKMLIMPKMSLL